ncbi:MAG: PKD domain-containing protein [Bacteroidetes bacterium]|nr:PKD domain-containing protein [Bacteroidota bacterium]MBU1579398.1 PKD domain-containing protein [Bacteroidota bacterium]MBU2558499.1 PKD domain-containing protein [Bacteroidota bacterium]
MKTIKILIGILTILTLMLSACKRGEYVEYRNSSAQEKEIIEKSREIFPEVIVQQLENELINLSQQEDQLAYLDSINIALDGLKAIIPTVNGLTFTDYKNTLDSTVYHFNNFKSTANDNCLGLAYSRSAMIDGGASGNLAGLLAASLSASGGGGISYIYDFVNLDRQIYLSRMCAVEGGIGVGLAAALQSNIGFTGIYEVTSGIRYHFSASGEDKFNGVSVGNSFGISGAIFALLGLDLSISVGTSKEAHGDSDFPQNLSPCPNNFTVIENSSKSFSFQMNGSLSAGVGGELLLLLTLEHSGTELKGVAGTYHRFGTNRTLAGIRMANELLMGEPDDGILIDLGPVNIAASALAIVYSQKDFSNCPAEAPSVGTFKAKDITSHSAVSGGIVTSGQGASVTAKGVCWSTNPDPIINDNKTDEGPAGGIYSSNLTGLSPNTSYYVRAYATNSAGTAYGQQKFFTTNTASGEAPVADFTANPTLGDAPLEVNFTDQSTNDPTSWLWDFGDGTTSTQQNPTKTYNSEGTYNITLTVSNTYGSNTLTKDNYITVTNGSGNTPPTALFTVSPTSGTTSTNFAFDAGGSTDNETPTSQLQVRWDFDGNGSWDTNWDTDKTQSHQYSSEGTYTAKLAVKDTEGLTDQYTKSITVSNGGGGFNDVFNPATGQTWMDRNLGASRVAQSSTDEQAYGDLYQWGRLTDGHEKRNSGTTSTLSNSDTPGHDNFILAPNSPADWRSPQNDNLWQGVNGINNPCPAGYRLPTEAEWEAERQSWSSNNATGAFNSPLKLPVAGHRYADDGSLYAVGSISTYWSATLDGISARLLYFYDSQAYMYSHNRAHGFSVRCLKN